MNRKLYKYCYLVQASGTWTWSLVLTKSRGWNKRVEHVPLQQPATNDFTTGDWKKKIKIYRFWQSVTASGPWLSKKYKHKVHIQYKTRRREKKLTRSILFINIQFQKREVESVLIGTVFRMLKLYVLLTTRGTYPRRLDTHGHKT